MRIDSTRFGKTDVDENDLLFFPRGLVGFPDLKRWAVIRFGKGLQLTNILRDIPADLRRGRCYLPMEDLKPAGLTAAALKNPSSMNALKPVLRMHAKIALGHLDAAIEYVTAIPRREWRLRLACLWPLLLALDTLSLVIGENDLLNPNKVVKVSRSEVSRLLRSSVSAVFSNRVIRRFYDEKRGGVLGSLSR